MKHLLDSLTVFALLLCCNQATWAENPFMPSPGVLPKSTVAVKPNPLSTVDAYSREQRFLVPRPVLQDLQSNKPNIAVAVVHLCGTSGEAFLVSSARSRLPFDKKMLGVIGSLTDPDSDVTGLPPAVRDLSYVYSGAQVSGQLAELGAPNGSALRIFSTDAGVSSSDLASGTGVESVVKVFPEAGFFCPTTSASLKDLSAIVAKFYATGVARQESFGNSRDKALLKYNQVWQALADVAAPSSSRIVRYSNSTGLIVDRSVSWVTDQARISVTLEAQGGTWRLSVVEESVPILPAPYVSDRFTVPSRVLSGFKNPGKSIINSATRSCQNGVRALRIEQVQGKDGVDLDDVKVAVSSPGLLNAFVAEDTSGQVLLMAQKLDYMYEASSGGTPRTQIWFGSDNADESLADRSGNSSDFVLTQLYPELNVPCQVSFSLLGDRSAKRALTKAFSLVPGSDSASIGFGKNESSARKFYERLWRQVSEVSAPVTVEVGSGVPFTDKIPCSKYSQFSKTTWNFGKGDVSLVLVLDAGAWRIHLVGSDTALADIHQ